MPRHADQRKAEREQEDEEYADADGRRVDLMRQQEFEAGVDDSQAIAGREPPGAARGPVRRGDHGECDGKNAGHGHVDAKHKGSSHRPTHYRTGQRNRRSRTFG